MDINRYNKISKNKPRIRYNIETHIPRPSDKDYTRGYVIRYFVQKVNDKGSPIYEIDNDGPPMTGRARIASSNQVKCSFAKNKLIMPSLAKINFHE